MGQCFCLVQGKERQAPNAAQMLKFQKGLGSEPIAEL